MHYKCLNMYHHSAINVYYHSHQRSVPYNAHGDKYLSSNVDKTKECNQKIRARLSIQRLTLRVQANTVLLVKVCRN